MNLGDYKQWYIRDDGHWYVSKVKQFSKESIQLFAKSLVEIDSVINAKEGDQLWDKYQEFRPGEPAIDGNTNKKRIFVNDYSKLYISLIFLKKGLIDLSHLESTNQKKFNRIIEIQKHFLEEENYDFFFSKYGKSFLNNDIMVYYRNFKSWLGKFGFYAEVNKVIYITDVGREFLNKSNDTEITSAIFLNQVKRYQLWNPTIPEKYQDYRIRPYFLLLKILMELEGHYFSKIEYALFVTKIKSHNEKQINDQINLISEFRLLSPENQTKYVSEVKALDKKTFKKRKRTNYATLLDSASKEIDCYGFGGLIERGEGRYVGQYLLSDKTKANEQLEQFEASTKFIHFNDKESWIAHHGSLKDMSIDSIIKMYLNSGMSGKEIQNELGSGEDLINSISDKVYEREIEDYYVNNIQEIDKNLVVVRKPTYGRQFRTSVGPIDILCQDKKTKEYVVCELKRGQGNDETMGQILRYMGWVYEHLSQFESPVRGILIGADFDNKLDYALSGVQSDDFYNLIVKFKHPFTDKNKPKIG